MLLFGGCVVLGLCCYLGVVYVYGYVVWELGFGAIGRLPSTELGTGGTEGKEGGLLAEYQKLGSAPFSYSEQKELKRDAKAKCLSISNSLLECWKKSRE